MIRLFKKGETNFNHNKWVLSECISCTITEDIYGIFDLDLEYPLIDTKNISQYLVRGNIIKTPIYDSRGEQLFRIRKATVNTKDKKVTVYAQAIARADLMNDMVLGLEIPAGKSRKEAGALLLAAALDSKSTYSIGNLDTSTNTTVNLGLDDDGNIIDYLDIAYVSPLEGFLADGDSDISIYNAYGGEIRFNNFTIDMVDERGSNYSFTIKSGKNLQEFEQEIDDTSDDFATALIMKSSDDVYLPNNEIIYSGNVDTLGKKYKVITCDDVSAVDDTTAALEIVYEQLRERGQKKFTEDKIDELAISLTVNFAELKKTEEYKNYSILEKCELGNTVTVEYINVNNITATARITQIKYDPLALNGQGKITEVEITNSKKTSIVDTINSTVSNVEDAEDDIEDVESSVEDVEDSVSNLTVTMQENDDNILLEVRNNKTNVDASITVMEGEIQERVTNTEYTSEIDILEGKIASKVATSDFGTLIEQNASSVVTTIYGESSNKVTIDSDGLSILDGGFSYRSSYGDTLIESGIPSYLQLGDPGWLKSKALGNVKVGPVSLGQYFVLSNIYIDSNLDMDGNTISDVDTYYGVDLQISGSKNCIQQTENYGKRLINAYETAEYYFGDIGSGIIENGECLIAIDPILQECINTNIEYHVFTQIYNEGGSITLIDRQPNYFIVHGTNGTVFSWEIKAKRKGYESNRLELSKN